MQITATETVQAFFDVQDKMEYLTKHVHNYVLLEGYMKHNRKRIVKALQRIIDNNDELLLQTLIGKLRHKLPPLRLGITLSHFDRKRAVIIASALIAQVMIDNGSLKTETRTETLTVNGEKKFRKLIYVILGGESQRDLLEGFVLEPGVVNQRSINDWKLNRQQKEFLAKVSSIPFKISDWCTKELLMKGYSLKTDWGKTRDKNGKKLPEDPIIRKRRYERYADKIVDTLKALPLFYLPAKYDDRGRVYYEAAKPEGVRPHGKLWETLMIDAAEPYMLTDEDARILNHIIYVTIYGRATIDQANERITENDYHNIGELCDPMDAETEEEFGESILLWKALEALECYWAGKPTCYMFGYDFTNSGLLMAGVSFKSPQMMKSANIAGTSDEVIDSHAAFGEAHRIPHERKTVKKMHMALLHGGTNLALHEQLVELMGDDAPSLDEIAQHNREAYGDTVMNITNIADWGTQIIGNKQSTLRWTMPDGFSACSRAYMTGVPVHVYVASASHKEGYTSHVIVSSMPYLEDKDGFPVYDKNTELGGTKYPVVVKNRGLYANITHSIDSYMLRHITNAVLDSGRPILLKHDDFIAPPGAHQVIMTAAKEVFDDLYHTNLYESAVNEIAEHSPYHIEPLDLIEGDAEFTVWNSNNFLMP